MPTVCKIALLDAPPALSRDFDYLVPPHLEDGVSRGRVVAVPFGRGDHISYGVILSVGEEHLEGRVLKPVLSLLPDTFTLTEPMLRLAAFLSEYTLASLGQSCRAMLPTAALGRVTERYYAAEGAPLSPLVELLTEHPGMEAEEIREKVGKSALTSALKAGHVLRRDTVADSAAPKTVAFYRPLGDRAALGALCAEEAKTLRSPGQKRLLALLLEADEWEEKDLIAKAGATKTNLCALVSKGYAQKRVEEVTRLPFAPTGADPEPIVLSRQQTAAYRTLKELTDTKEPRAALLYGVTGSGKTKVMMRLLDDVLAEGRRAIVMVPEISLTPQTVGIFCSRYGEGVAVIHSALSAGERFDAFRRCKEGQVRLVIGTRSAVLAPLENLGLIVIDEEHEHTYKSDQDPKYHAKDVAAFRCKESGATLLLASATPSVESYYRAKSGRYTLVKLTERFGNAALPDVTLVDMREELRRGNTSPLSDAMYEALKETVEDGGQAILFCNRRGYSSAVSCRSCGEALNCPNCSVALTHHASYAGGYLLCHTCGYRVRPPKECPSCKSERLAYMGFGTQKAEGEIENLLGEGRVMRMDADTTTGKAAYDRLLSKFRKREADVLLGTQMVTKGHDFPDVTLSGVLLADAALHMNDYRAGERAFALITQVVGRAGRGRRAGRAIIQTYCPDHDVITLAASQDYERFYEREIVLRRAACFPPFCDIGQVMLQCPDEGELLRVAAETLEQLKAALSEAKLPVELYGPLEMPTYKAGGKYRLKFVLKCRLNAKIRAFLGDFLKGFAKRGGNVTLSVDLNPA